MVRSIVVSGRRSLEGGIRREKGVVKGRSDGRGDEGKEGEEGREGDGWCSWKEYKENKGKTKEKDG